MGVMTNTYTYCLRLRFWRYVSHNVSTFYYY